MQGIVTNRPKALAVARTARAWVEAKLVVSGTAAARRHDALHGQELGERESQTHGERELIVTRASRGIQGKGEDREPRPSVLSTSRHQASALAIAWLRAQHLVLTLFV